MYSFLMANVRYSDLLCLIYHFPKGDECFLFPYDNSNFLLFLYSLISVWANIRWWMFDLLHDFSEPYLYSWISTPKGKVEKKKCNMFRHGFGGYALRFCFWVFRADLWRLYISKLAERESVERSLTILGLLLAFCSWFKWPCLLCGSVVHSRAQVLFIASLRIL